MHRVLKELAKPQTQKFYVAFSVVPEEAGFIPRETDTQRWELSMKLQNTLSSRTLRYLKDQTAARPGQFEFGILPTVPSTPLLSARAPVDDCSGGQGEE